VTPRTVTLPAPAKLNLYLHITGRREDGYHLLETLFQFLDIYDELTFELTDKESVELISSDKQIPEHDNLVYKAAMALTPYKQEVRSGVKIRLNKKLPMGGGLGGGSSDAATTLLALNSLWNLNLTLNELETIGLKLGADVPVFVRGTACFAQGIGEHMSPAAPQENWYLVLVPDVHVSTAAIFNHPDLPRSTPSVANEPELWQNYHNDCEKLVCELYPQVAKLRDWLLKYAPSRMTGTGACVFAAFTTKAEAAQVLAKLPENYHGFIARGCNISPVHQWFSATQSGSRLP